MPEDRDTRFAKTTLDNGLRVVVTEQPQLHRAHLALYVAVGSRFETEETNGLSHFLEHMLYRGTPSLRSAHEVNLAFEELGGFLYAATHVDFGVFSVTLPPESVAAASRLFGEVMRAPIFSDIDVEKGIVCEEILEDLDDEGRQVDADNLSRALIYPKHPLGFTITGDARNVRSFTEAHLRAHHAKHYTAANAVAVFSGAVSASEAFDLAAEAFGALPRGERVRADCPVHTQKKPRLKVQPNVSSQTELRLSFRAPGERAPERPALDMLMRILDDGMSTRLYHRICDTKGLCYDVSASYDGYEDDGVLDLAAGVQHARAATVTEELLALLGELATSGPSARELEKARRRAAWDTRAMKDSPEDLGGYFGCGLLFDRFDTPEQLLEKHLAVTADEIGALAATLARPERLNAVAVGLLSSSERSRLTDLVRGYGSGR